MRLTNLFDHVNENKYEQTSNQVGSSVEGVPAVPASSVTKELCQNGGDYLGRKNGGYKWPAQREPCIKTLYTLAIR